MAFTSNSDAQTVTIQDGFGVNNIFVFDGSGCSGTAFTKTLTLHQQHLVRVSGRFFKGTLNSGGERVILSFWNNGACTSISPQATTTKYTLDEVILSFTEPLAWPLTIVQE